MRVMIGILVFSILASAQTKQPADPITDKQPDYDQTRKWIIKKMGEAGFTHTDKRLGKEEVGVYEAISIDDCELTFTETEEDTVLSNGLVGSSLGGSDVTTKDTTVIPLGKVSLVRIGHEDSDLLGSHDWNVLMDLDGPAVTHKMVETRRGIPGETIKNYPLQRDASISFGRSRETDEDSAKRMMKALDRAVFLCKGKTEPF